MAILESVRELASKLGAETNGRDITDQINKINKHLDETALGGRDIAEAVRTYSMNASGGGGGETFEVILNSSDGETFTPNKTFAETVTAMRNQTPVIMKMRFENGGQTLEQVTSFFYNATEPESINAIYVPVYFTNSSMNGYIWNENGFGASTFYASIS